MQKYLPEILTEATDLKNLIDTVFTPNINNLLKEKKDLKGDTPDLLVKEVDIVNKIIDIKQIQNDLKTKIDSIYYKLSEQANKFSFQKTFKSKKNKTLDAKAELIKSFINELNKMEVGVFNKEALFNKNTLFNPKAIIREKLAAILKNKIKQNPNIVSLANKKIKTPKSTQNRVTNSPKLTPVIQAQQSNRRTQRTI